MSHQQDSVIPFRTYGCQCRIDIREILRKAFAEKWILVGEDGTPVFSQVHRIEVVTVCIHAITQLLLKKVIVVTMNIQDRLFYIGQLGLLDQRRRYPSPNTSGTYWAYRLIASRINKDVK